ncbi:MAG: hypothetical protein ACO1N9_12960 [Flavobacterium sp.]
MPLPLDRTFHYKAKLLISRSRMISGEMRPKDDIINWLLADIGIGKFTFIYKIHEPDNADFDKPFAVDISFLTIDSLASKIRCGDIFKVSRGEESIGCMIIAMVL